MTRAPDSRGRARDDVHRGVLILAETGEGGHRIGKRVIGLPNKKIAIINGLVVRPSPPPDGNRPRRVASGRRLGHRGVMEYEADWVTAYGNEDGRSTVNRMLSERVAGGWEVHSHSVVQVESTGQSEYVPQGHPLFTHFFLFRR